MSLLTNSRERLIGDFGGVPVLDYEVGVRVHEVPALGAPEERAGVHDSGVVEGVPWVKLLLERQLAPWAPERVVEGVQSHGLRTELVVEPFYCGHHLAWIHLLEGGHKGTLGMIE